MELEQRLLVLAGDCALRTAGSMLDGIVHNLNNPTHALSMQGELLAKSLKKDIATEDVSTLENKFERLRHVGEEFRSQLEVLTWRNTYCKPGVELVDPVHFGTWFLQFWRNNLFFKHNMTVDLETDPPPPHVQLIPLALVWSLEEPLYAMTRTVNNGHVQTEFGMRFEIRRVASAGLFFRMMVSSASGARDFPAFSMEHEQSVSALTRALGWDWQYANDENLLTVQLTIPGRTRTATSA